MNVVGRVGSLISQGVYSVAMPFHPFGGAVDIIVVEQEDGTYRSTPWYVRFGKFQGFIKGAEKVVTINVNGVEADFHMYLDHSGQAYFMREIEVSDTQSSGGTSIASSPHKTSQDDTTANNDEVHESVNMGHKEGEGNGQHPYRDEHTSSHHSSPRSSGFSPYSYGNLEDVEEMVKSSNDSNSEMVLVSVDGHVLTAPISADEEESTDYVQSTSPQFHLGPGKGSSEEFDAIFGDLDASAFKDENTSGKQLEGGKDAKEDYACNEETHENSNFDTGSGEDTNPGASVCHEDVSEISLRDTDTSPKDSHICRKNDDLFKSCLDLASHGQDGDLQDMGSDPENNLVHSSEVSSFSEVVTEENAVTDNWNYRSDTLQCAHTRVEESENRVSVDSKLEHAMIASDVNVQNSDVPTSENSPVPDNVTDSSEKVPVTEKKTHMDSANYVSNSMDPMGSVSRRSDVEGECNQLGTGRSISCSGFELSLCGNLLLPGMGLSSAEEAFEAHRISEEDFKGYGPSIIKDRNLIVRYNNSYFPWDKAAYTLLGKAAFGSNFSDEPQDAIPVEHVRTPKAKEDAYANSASNQRWRLWPIPFRRGASLQHSNSNSSSEEFFVDSESAIHSPRTEQNSNVNNNRSPRKQLLRTYIPTTEQIASLNLKDGQNNIAFSFSTRVLGKQEVDAHIYLWKWNARIVISDVDGTITKSDVLGQVMPLVGKDWTQSGVAGLFSAIKENGYQLLFLSARAIVQAYLTRSFLLNLKQDGKALPSGPVVISPDGLFPSLFREVIRRAPHEFKIACLEDIKALFPSDYNPFYAGFGNRDTDELSYRKIGIPKGKIFIINPKGEVAINHCIDVKSYTSLHTLVNDMFPPTSLVEQEDFNSWNYWRMPLPEID